MEFEIAILVVLFALVFEYTNGFHDAANVISTVIATKALAPMSAIVMAGVLNFLGATQISGVAKTIATGLIAAPHVSQLVVLAAIFGAIIWNLLTWYLAIPSSSSYALIGGLLGAAWTQAGTTLILWSGVLYKVLLPMVFSPFLGFGIAWILMKTLYLACPAKLEDKKGIFRNLQIGSACFVALSHGMNDAQKSMGIITLGLFSGGLLSHLTIPLWVIFLCAITIALGTASGGFRIVKTMGFSITTLVPAQGCMAESAASLVILAASFLGMPISSTHVITGCITGVGSAKAHKAVQWNTLKRLAITWICTLPGAGILGSFFYLIINTLF